MLRLKPGSNPGYATVSEIRPEMIKSRVSRIHPVRRDLQRTWRNVLRHFSVELCIRIATKNQDGSPCLGRIG